MNEVEECAEQIMEMVRIAKEEPETAQGYMARNNLAMMVGLGMVPRELIEGIE